MYCTVRLVFQLSSVNPGASTSRQVQAGPGNWRHAKGRSDAKRARGESVQRPATSGTARQSSQWLTSDLDFNKRHKWPDILSDLSLASERDMWS